MKVTLITNIQKLYRKTTQRKKNESEQKFSMGKATLQNLFEIGEKLHKELALAIINILKNKNKSSENFASSKNRRPQQIKTVSDENLIKHLFDSEQIIRTIISSLTKYRDLYKIHLQNILDFYRKL